MDARTSNERVERLRGQAGMHRHEMRRRPHHPDRGEIGCRIIGQLPVQTLVDGLRSVGADEQRVTVGLGARCFCGSEIAAGAGLVLDHDRLAERGFQMFRQQPCREIGASSRWKRHDDDNGLGRPKRIGRRLRNGWNSRSLSGCGGESEHQMAAIERHCGFLSRCEPHPCGPGVTPRGNRLAFQGVLVAALLRV